MAKWIKPSTPRKVKFAKGINKGINDLLDAKHEQEQNEENQQPDEEQQVNEDEQNGEAEHKEEQL